ncbi:MAG: agmatinase [Promethearchaeota archaeon]|nr:MAG: agmatinase [Candidatus Lokiarchaeota archaeon]
MNFFDFGEVIEIDTDFAIFGIPWDYLTSIELPNSAIAPKKIRESTNDLALTTELGAHIPKIKAIDLGDIEIEEFSVEKNLKKINEFVEQIYEKNETIVPVMIGGDHFCTYPVVKAVGNHFKNKNNFGVLLFDSHLDFYEEWDKGVYSHATISHRIYDLDYINKNNLLIVGTRDIDIPELELAREEKLTYLNAYELLEDGVKKYVSKIITFFQTQNIESLYVSIDIDALDPSIAPGTGFAIPGGFSYREMWYMLKEIADHLEIIGFDIVEVAPNLDLRNKITCNLASKLIVELMSFIARNKKR